MRRGRATTHNRLNKLWLRLAPTKAEPVAVELDGRSLAELRNDRAAMPLTGDGSYDVGAIGERWRFIPIMERQAATAGARLVSIAVRLPSGRTAYLDDDENDPVWTDWG